MRPVLRRIPVALALGGLLVLPMRAAAGSFAAGAAPTPIASSAPGAGLLGALWSWVRLIWPAAPAAAGHQRPDAGCGMDPDGRCVSPAPRVIEVGRGGQQRPDAGCLIDPNG